MKRIFSTGYNTGLFNLWLLILRITIGIFMLTHGLPKLQQLLAGNLQFADPFGWGSGISLALVVFAEFLCSIFIIIGFATRLSTIPIIITMLVAAFSASAGQPFVKKEFPLLYLIIFITVKCFCLK